MSHFSEASKLWVSTNMTQTSDFGLVAKRSVSFDVPVKRQPIHAILLPSLYDLTSPALISS